MAKEAKPALRLTLWIAFGNHKGFGDAHGLESAIAMLRTSAIDFEEFVRESYQALNLLSTLCNLTCIAVNSTVSSAQSFPPTTSIVWGGGDDSLQQPGRHTSETSKAT